MCIFVGDDRLVRPGGGSRARGLDEKARDREVLGGGGVRLSRGGGDGGARAGGKAAQTLRPPMRNAML